MYKLKVKRSGQSSLTTYYFSTLKEVADRIACICDARNLADVLKAQKEFNYRFYVTFSKNY